MVASPNVGCFFRLLLCHLPAISSLLLPRFAITSGPQQRLLFLPESFTETDLSGNADFLQRVEKVTSVGCNCLILILVVDFDYDCQLTFSKCIVIFP